MKRFAFLFFTVITLLGMIVISGCKKQETYTVTFNPNGGTGTMQQQVFTEGEQQALTKNTFMREGYVFSGWNGNGVNYIDEQNIAVNCDMTMYALWTTADTNPTPSPQLGNIVTVTFDANGGIGEMAPQTFTIGTAQALNANSFTWYNHEFIGWNSVQDGTGTAYAERQEITIEGNITLYAQWMVATGLRVGHYYVDLGLPSGTKWATCNIGANSPIAYGDYFAWGETTTKEIYYYSTYKYCNGSYNTLTKYCYNADFGNNGFTDNLTTLQASDDAATANWGGGWRMPTETEMTELLNKCTHEWTIQNGVNGEKFTGPNGNSIFLPAAGRRYDTDLSNVSSGDYWSSSLYTSYYSSSASCLCFASNSCYVGVDSRIFGLSVRPVCQ